MQGGKKGEEARRAVFTLDYFCGVVPVCSSCRWWIIRNGMSLPPAAFSVFHERSENFQEQKKKLPVAGLATTPLRPAVGHPD